MLELNVCIGSSCHHKGSYNVIQAFQQLIEEESLHGKINLKSGFCLKQCQCEGVAVTMNGVHCHVIAEKADDFFLSEVVSRL
jgi:NADH:ubiquinone oxidoreductase subunit E